MTEPVVMARQLVKRFGDEVAVSGLDLEICTGSVVGCIGPSGSGKTTAVRLLTGLLRPTSGAASVFGVPPTQLTADDRVRIGYMPQLGVLYPHLSLGQNLGFASALYGLSGRRRRRRVRETLEFVQLWGDRRKLLRQTSGGMQRRLALAAALVHEPTLLFLDEPTAGIDPVLRNTFWQHFTALKQQGRTLFVTTQYVGEAAYCDLVAVLTDGRLLVLDTPEGLRLRAYGGEMVDVTVEEILEDHLVQRVPVLEARREGADGRGLRLLVEDAGVAIPRLQTWFSEQGVRLVSVEPYVPPFDDVFVELVGRERARAAAEPPRA